jgi:hypothetical protein
MARAAWFPLKQWVRSQALHLQTRNRSRSIVEGSNMAYWFVRNAVVVMFAIVVAGTLVILK